MNGEGEHGHPLVTAGVTAFNAMATIERAVRSALAQRWDPLEVLVVDDASTDGTVEVLAGLEGRYPQVRVIRHKRNQGASAARNTIIANARGEFIAFFDDDDISSPDRIAHQYARLCQTEDRDGTARPLLCHTARIDVHPDGRRSYRGVAGVHPDRPAPGAQELVDHILQGRPLLRESEIGALTCTQFARRATYLQVGGFDPSFRRAEDTEFNVRFGAAGGTLLGVAEPLVERHVTTGPHKGVAVDGAAMLALLSKHRDLLPDLASYAAGRRWIQGRTALRQGERGEALHHLAVAWMVAPGRTTRRLSWGTRRGLGYGRGPSTRRVLSLRLR